MSDKWYGFMDVVRRTVCCRMVFILLLVGVLSVPVCFMKSVLAAEPSEQELDRDPALMKQEQADYEWGEDSEDAAQIAGDSMPIVKSPFTKSTYRHARRFAGYKVAHGIDVSQWQGNIDWKRVKRAGVRYAIIRVGYRGAGTGRLMPDSRYVSYIKGALKAGIKVGVYIYSQATTPAEARAEANYVLKRIKGYDISMPVVLDYEFYTSTSGRLLKAHLTKRKATDVCEAFCKTVESAGYVPMVYANGDMMNNHLYAEELAKTRLMWLANFGKNNGKDRGFATAYNGTYSFWQYTSRGRVPGIRGYTDLNFWYQTSEIQKKKTATKLAITADSITLKAENEANLYYGLTPADCTDEITWTSSRPDVAYVKDATVYGVSAGETVITASTPSGVSDSVKVYVSANLKEYKIDSVSTFTYNGHLQEPAVKVVSKKAVAASGKVKKEADLFSGPSDSYNLLGTLKKGKQVNISGQAGLYYAVTYQKGDQTVSGYVKKEQLSVSKEQCTLVLDRDYSVKYTDNQNAGTGLIEVSGAGDGRYSGIVSGTMTIAQAVLSGSMVKQVQVTGVSGQAALLDVVLKDQGVMLKKGVDYTITTPGNASLPGGELLLATIAGQGNYKGTVTISYAVGSEAFHAGTVTDTQVGVAGAVAQDVQQVDFGQEQNISEASVTVLGDYVYNQKEQVPELLVQHNGRQLVAGTDYDMVLSHNSCAGEATIRLIGRGAYAGEKEVTFTIAKAPLSRVSFAKIASQEYAGRAVTPALDVRDQKSSLLAGVDYQAVYENNVKRGKALVTITGQGNYTGSRTISFRIGKKQVKNLKIKAIGNYKYKGRRIKPKLSVLLNGRALKAGRDYTVRYGANKKVGKATVTICGKGNFTGKKTISFRIVR